MSFHCRGQEPNLRVWEHTRLPAILPSPPQAGLFLSFQIMLLPSIHVVWILAPVPSWKNVCVLPVLLDVQSTMTGQAQARRQRLSIRIVGLLA